MHMQYINVMKRVTNPKTRMTMPMFHMTGGSVSWRTMMNPMQMRMRARLARTIRQHTPRVFGQNGLGADIVSTASPAFIVFLDFTVLIPLAAVMAVPEKVFRLNLGLPQTQSPVLLLPDFADMAVGGR